MRTKTKLTIAALAIAMAAAPAAAVVTTFASFSPSGNGANLRWVISGNNANGNFSRNATFYSTATSSANVAGTRTVTFSFLQPSIASFVTNVGANFTMNGSVTNTAATLSGTTLSQTNINGTFSFTSRQAITIGSTTFAAGANLLSGSFSGAEISGTRGGTAAGFSGSTPGTSITYTSDFLNFQQNSNYDFALSMTSIAPTLNALNSTGGSTGTPARALRSFRAVIGGTFSSDPAPITPAIPEPESWVMMIAGFGLVGLSSRRRRKVVAA